MSACNNRLERFELRSVLALVDLVALDAAHLSDERMHGYALRACVLVLPLRPANARLWVNRPVPAGDEQHVVVRVVDGPPDDLPAAVLLALNASMPTGMNPSFSSSQVTASRSSQRSSRVELMNTWHLG